jgi:hypothetical protein
MDNADLWLTADEFDRVAEELAAVLEPYRRRAQPGNARQAADESGS